LNDIKVNNASSLNIDRVEDMRRSVSSMVPAAANPDDSWLIHLLAIFRGDLPGESDDSRDDQDLRGLNSGRGEWDQPDIW
jgi:hypothetical protein